MTKPMRALTTRRGMSTLVLVLPAGVLAVLAVVIGMQGAGGDGEGGGEPPGVTVDAVLVAQAVGCTPEAMAMANCDAEDAASVFLMLKQSEAASELTTTEASLSALSAQRSDLQATARRFGATGDLGTQLASVSLQHDTALSSRDALRAEVRAEITEAAAGMGGVDEEALAAAMANAQRDVELKYRVLTLDDASWSKLEDALAQPSAESINDEAQAVLDAANASAAVAAAELNLADSFTLGQLKAAYQAEAAGQ